MNTETNSEIVIGIFKLNADAESSNDALLPIEIHQKANGKFAAVYNGARDVDYASLDDLLETHGIDSSDLVKK